MSITTFDPKIAITLTPAAERYFAHKLAGHAGKMMSL
jgi:hypothetical protein